MQSARVAGVGRVVAPLWIRVRASLTVTVTTKKLTVRVGPAGSVTGPTVRQLLGRDLWSGTTTLNVEVTVSVGGRLNCLSTDSLAVGMCGPLVGKGLEAFRDL